MRWVWLVSILAACGGPTAEAPLTIPLGLSHDAAAHALRAHQFCRDPGELMDGDQELFPRCDRTNAELGDAWVTAIFDHDKLVELRRWERYGDDARALERWNALVTARMKLGASSPDAKRALEARLQPGTRALEAFRAPGGAMVGVYLLTPGPPEQASILEKVVLPAALAAPR